MKNGVNNAGNIAPETEKGHHKHGDPNFAYAVEIRAETVDKAVALANYTFWNRYQKAVLEVDNDTAAPADNEVMSAIRTHLAQPALQEVTNVSQPPVNEPPVTAEAQQQAGQGATVTNLADYRQAAANTAAPEVKPVEAKQNAA